MNNGKYLLSTIFVFCFIMIAGITPILASESTEVITDIENQVDKSEESSSIDSNLEKEVEIQPYSLVGGGVATQKGHVGYAEIGIDLIAPGVRIQSAHLTFTLYKKFGDMDPKNNIPYRTIPKSYYPNGSSFIEDEFNVNLPKGEYTFSVTGTMFSYNSDVALSVKQFWSKPFTVK